MSKKISIVVLASGRGSNLQALIQAQPGYGSYEIKAVVSDIKDAPALNLALQAHIPTQVVLPIKGEKRADYAQKLIDAIEIHKPDFIVLAGFMRLLAPSFIAHFSERIINIHPSLLPAFTGLHAQKQALDYGVRFSGCTVHFVDEGCDTGPIILQSVVPVLENDTEDTLSTRILVEEHKLLPKAVDLLAQNKVKISGRKINIGG